MYYILNELEQTILSELKESLSKLESPYTDKLDLLLHENFKTGAVIKRFVLLLSTHVKNNDGIPVCHAIINTVLKELTLSRPRLNSSENLKNFISCLTRETIKKFSVKVRISDMKEWNLENALETGDLLSVRFLKNIRNSRISAYRIEDLNRLRLNLEHYLSPVEIELKEENREAAHTELYVPPFPIEPDFVFVED